MGLFFLLLLFCLFVCGFVFVCLFVCLFVFEEKKPVKMWGYLCTMNRIRVNFFNRLEAYDRNQNFDAERLEDDDCFIAAPDSALYNDVSVLTSTSCHSKKKILIIICASLKRKKDITAKQFFTMTDF